MSDWKDTYDALMATPCAGGECESEMIAPSTVFVHRCQLHAAADHLQTAAILHLRRDNPDAGLADSLSFFRNNWKNWTIGPAPKTEAPKSTIPEDYFSFSD